MGGIGHDVTCAGGDAGGLPGRFEEEYEDL